jgi:ABC-type multidrug transport system permease subunit
METLRVVRDRGALFWMLLFPVLYAGLFGMLQFEGSRSARVGICVANADSGFLGAAIRGSLERFSAEMLDSAALAEYGREDLLFITDVAPSDTVPEPCTRLLSLPQGLTDSLRLRRTACLVLRDESGAADPSGLTAQALAWRAVTENLARFVVASMDSSADVAARFDSLTRRLPRIRVRSSFVGGVMGVPSGLTQAVPGIMVMMVLMILATHSTATLAAERQRGLLQHLASTPASRADIIAGKLIGRFLIGGVQIVILWGLAALAQHGFGLWIGYRLPSAIPVLFVYGFAVAALGLCIAAAVRSVDTGVGVGIVVTLAMAALGGCWWPLEIVPRGMQIAGHLFPTAWAMDALHQVMAYDRGVGATLPHMGILAAYGLAFTIVGVRLLKTF